MVNSPHNADVDVARDKTLQYKITHVFCPLQLPGGDDHSPHNDYALSEAVYTSAQAYAEHVSVSAKPQWKRIVRMLRNLNDTTAFEALDEKAVVFQLQSMNIGDVLSYFVRAQNAAVIFRKLSNKTLAESFEVSPCAKAVMSARGKLVCSYPGPAIAVPNEAFGDSVFASELAHFLCQMNEDTLDAAPTTHKAGSTMVEERDTVHPRYITELLTGILRGVGMPADIQRIAKRIGDDVVWNNSRVPWRRSPLWLIIRVAIQTTLKRDVLGQNIYKTFMLFFMNDLAQKALLHDMSNDVLQWTVAKLSRRLTKLGDSAPEWLSIAVLATCTSTRALLDARWKQVQSVDNVCPLWEPSTLDFSADARLSMIHSSHYITNALSSIHSTSPSSPFQPESRVRGTLDHFLSVNGKYFQVMYKHEPYLTLYDVENEVRLGIDGWVAGVSTPDIDGASKKLELLAEGYSTAALRTYKGNPEDISRMFLTVIELWIGLDKLVARQIPMFTDYSPEIPTSLLDRLLVRHPESLVRLRLASQYIRGRHSMAMQGWSVFSDQVDVNSFAVCYYNESSQLQAIMSRVVRDANSSRAKKVEELQALNALHTQLQEQVAHASHAYKPTNGKHAKKRCEKCKLEKNAKEMMIGVHEWPLPADSCRAANVVFELECPVAFDMWRSATFHLLVDLCSPPREATHPHIVLEQYSGLHPYYTKRPRTRVTLASNTKPFMKSHYRLAPIPCNEDRVCVNSGLNLYYFDTNTSIQVSDAFSSLDISFHCSYHFCPGPYQNMQTYLQDTTHTSNDVICSQADCHKDLSIHEFIAFGHLRSGPFIQWLNILREIRANTLSFRRDEVHMLFAQAASQVGPCSNNGEMDWHRELECSSFCRSLLTELESLVAEVSGNWLEGMTMNTVTLLVCRLLAGWPNVEDGSDIIHQAYQLLRTVREETFCWVLELMEKLESTTNENEKLDLQSRLRDTAAICRSSFDVGEVTDTTQFLNSSRDTEILLSCAIIIHDNTPAKLDTLGEMSRLLLERDRRLLWKLWPKINNIIAKGSKGIDLAVKRVWPTYRQGSHWYRCGSATNASWFTCTTLKCAGQESQKLHLDILYGSLLVDGKAVGRLPHAIQQNPLFMTVFPNQILDVVPSDMVGMEYGTRGLISGHRVYFRMAGDELIIRAKEQQCDDILELIPSSKLESDLPNVLVEDHAHWLNLTTRSIEVRPLVEMWQSSPDNWHIQFAPGRHSMKKGNTNLLDIRSTTWKMVSSRLEPLEIPRNLVVTLTSGGDTSEVSVELPRYGLGFFINSCGELESRNLRNVVYDDTQSIGTLFGLVNRLVLRPKLSTADRQRCVLIPEGDVSFSRHGHHVKVLVDIHGPPHQRMTYQAYMIDTDLGCLTGNVSLTNKLYRAYLHALCSNPCSVDPLTKRTGTEEALSILRSAACRSFTKIDPRAAGLLHSIASLTTKRDWYPLHLQHMQRVCWASLPVASQHHGLYLSCASIVEIHQSLQLFHHGNDNSPSLVVDFPTRDKHLLQRASLRSAILYPPEFRKPPPGGNVDVTYNARDLLKHATGEVRAYRVALAVNSWFPQKSSAIEIYTLLENATKHLSSGTGTISLRYSKSWLSPNLDDWLPMYNMCRRSDKRQHRFQFLFSLAAMAYSSPNLDDIAHALVAFVVVPQFKHEHPPAYTSYLLSNKYIPKEQKLQSCVSSCAVPFKDSPEKSGEEYRIRLHRDKITAAAKLAVGWPRRTPPPCDFLDSSLYDLEKLSSEVLGLFSSCYQNWELKAHLDRVQGILRRVPGVSSEQLVDYSFTTASGTRSLLQAGHEETMAILFCRPPPTLPGRVTLQIVTAPIIPSAPGSEQLHQLIDTVKRSSINSFQVKYAEDLHRSESHNVLYRNKSPSVSPAFKHVELFSAHYVQCREGYIQCLDIIARRLGPQTRGECAVNESGQWPRITPKALLGCIASTSPIKVPPLWRDCLISFAKLGLEYQRARRMLLLAMCGQIEDLSKEMENTGCVGWEADSYPDWLLIQLEGNFLIRGIQVNVASEMIAPRSGRNTSLQLHMGEGKSSVIIPMAASALANGDQLVRVVVPKALTTQMYQLLVDRLGGLPNRRIYHLPFSRSHELQKAGAKAFLAILEECKREGGILVAQPEYILSFKLMTVEKQLGENKGIATELLRAQLWLHSHARDMLDECDEILHVRNQLVYTIGSQQPLQGFPGRWASAQQILGLVKNCAVMLQSRFPLGVEVEHRPYGAFPHFRILYNVVGEELTIKLAQDIMDGLLPNYSFILAPEHVCRAIFNFLTSMDIDPSEVRTVQDYLGDTHAWTGLLHLRGLLAFGILLFALKERRWRVDYGLAPWRTLLAVPYRAKDVPAPRAEFGQPDVAVVLTCLSYYYEGLTQEQLVICFERLLQQDDPTQEYEMWVRDLSPVPDALRHLSGINTESSQQWRDFLVPIFSYNKATIDFYLSQVVFPREAKEFSFKLSCSSWDLAEESTHVVTGFSGTNDGRYLLPTTITQRDPDHQRGTNARVLAYLLQPENGAYMKTSSMNGERRTAREFLELVVDQKPEIRAILDVGAQVLELQNSEFAAAWLEVKPDALAAIYFNEDDELTVITREETTQLLLESSFAHRLDECVVYLDDAHTRGTDIRFPDGFRAAVTLGPKVTKDRLTQGCMRMRKLGNGHSVMFFAPSDVDRSIRTITSKSESDAIRTMDILQWAMAETCAEIERRASLWAQQGVDHALRYDSWSNFCDHGEISLNELAEAWRQPDAKTLEELYAPASPRDLSVISIPNIRQRCLELGVLSLLNPNLDEEQEREVVHEVECERQVERLPKATPALHQVTRAIVRFVQGAFNSLPHPAFQRAFSPEVVCSIHLEDIPAWSQSLYVTSDFCRVILDRKGSEYLRPVNWILSRDSPSGPTFLILSPFEVNQLLLEIRTSKFVRLHIYTPRTHKTSRPCDDLLLHSIPTVPPDWTAPAFLVDQLNLFAGQLYLRDYSTYIRVCRFLCVYAKDLEDGGSFEVQSDGFIQPAHRPLRALRACSFQRSPLPFLRDLIGLRRMSMKFSLTHMGKILDGRLLREEDFFN